MKQFNSLVLFSCLLLLTAGCVSNKNFQLNQLKNGENSFIEINDPRWDGVTVPDGEQGKVCGGEDPHFPSISFNLKELNNVFGSKIIGIKMYAYDVNWKGGHHGKWSYEFDANANDFISPKIPSESTDMPPGVVGLSRHTAGNAFSSGYYLAPSSCVANRGHKYFTDITFELDNGESVKTTLSQGRY